MLLCTSVLLTNDVWAQQPAFPGAEGFGMYTTGGRGGTVYHVTNLNDSGTGSFREACNKSGVRTIVFDVSGTIHLKSGLSLRNGNVTIAGQTAPGDGICIADYPFEIKAKNVIIRYMRFRLGNVAIDEAVQAYADANGYTKAQVYANSDLLNNVTMPHEGDGLGGMDQENIVVDHCSVSWSVDECLSVYGSKNISVQWCIVSQSMVNCGHSKGNHGYGGNWGGSGASYHHNLVAHHTSRTPRLGPRPGTQTDERMDMRNNVIYNWGGNGCYGGEGMNVNIVNNYYKPGPATFDRSETYQKRIAGVGIRTTEYTKHGTSSPNQWDVMWHVWGTYYVNGNYNHSFPTMDEWKDGFLSQIDASKNDNYFNDSIKNHIHRTVPIDFPSTTTHTAAMAFDKVLSYAGASLHRDAVDSVVVADARNGGATYTGSGLSKGFINNQDDLRPSDATDDWCAWPTLTSLEAPTDTDGDGMPDEWETENGLDPNDKTDGAQLADDGYTNLEHYINGIVEAITSAQNADGTTESYTAPKEENNQQLDEMASGTIAWSMVESGSASLAGSVSDDFVAYVNISSASLGSGLKQGSIEVADGVSELKFNNTSGSATDANALTFDVAPAEGYSFKATHISFYASRFGTDGGKIDVSWVAPDGTTTKILTADTPERKGDDNGIDYSTYDIDIDMLAYTGTGSLKINIYGLGDTKYIGLSNIVVSGTVGIVKEDAETTAIKKIAARGVGSDDVYDLSGRRVRTASKGLYVVGGKLIRK